LTALETCAAAVVLGLSAGLSPGPLLALTIAQSLRHGSREGIRVAVAPLLTDVPIILASCLLLAHVADSRPILGVFTLLGATFVSYLAIESLRSPSLDLTTASSGPSSVGKGFIVNALSPHPYLFWFTVGAPMVLKAWAVSPVAALGFPLCFLASLVGVKVAVALLTGRSRALLSERVYATTMRLLGLALAVFAVMLARQGLAMLSLAAK
jgi:threonine/homoserine/homoserine lactone efflux protein